MNFMTIDGRTIFDFAALSRYDKIIVQAPLYGRANIVTPGSKGRACAECGAILLVGPTALQLEEHGLPVQYECAGQQHPQTALSLRSLT